MVNLELVGAVKAASDACPFEGEAVFFLEVHG